MEQENNQKNLEIDVQKVINSLLRQLMDLSKKLAITESLLEQLSEKE